MNAAMLIIVAELRAKTMTERHENADRMLGRAQSENHQLRAKIEKAYEDIGALNFALAAAKDKRKARLATQAP
jgi:cell division septum initiation protein DivIVA